MTSAEQLAEVDRDEVADAVRRALGPGAPEFEVLATYPAESPAPAGHGFAGIPESQCGRELADRTIVVETHIPSFGEGPSLTDVQWFLSRFDGEWVAWGNY